VSIFAVRFLQMLTHAHTSTALQQSKTQKTTLCILAFFFTTDAHKDGWILFLLDTGFEHLKLNNPTLYIPLVHHQKLCTNQFSQLANRHLQHIKFMNNYGTAYANKLLAFPH